MLTVRQLNFPHFMHKKNLCRTLYNYFIPLLMSNGHYSIFHNEKPFPPVFLLKSNSLCGFICWLCVRPLWIAFTCSFPMSFEYIRTYNTQIHEHLPDWVFKIRIILWKLYILQLLFVWLGFCVSLRFSPDRNTTYVLRICP